MRKSKVFQSDRNNKTVRDVREERDTGYARIPNRGGSGYLEMYWKMNDDAAADQVIKLEIDDKHVYVYWEDLLRYGRWV